MGQIDYGMLKVSWATYQIVSLVAWNLSVQFPPPFSNMLGILSFLQVDFLSFDCIRFLILHAIPLSIIL